MSAPAVTRFLTGITTTGTPHLGNFVGAIRPAVAASLRPGIESFYFLADYHALIKIDDPQRVQRSTLEHALAALTGTMPTTFDVKRGELSANVPSLPGATPSTVLQPG